MPTDENEIVEIEHPASKGTALRTRKQFDRLKPKGWQEVKNSEAAKAANESRAAEQTEEAEASTVAPKASKENG